MDSFPFFITVYFSRKFKILGYYHVDSQLLSIVIVKSNKTLTYEKDVNLIFIQDPFYEFVFNIA